MEVNIRVNSNEVKFTARARSSTRMVIFTRVVLKMASKKGSVYTSSNQASEFTLDSSRATPLQVSV